MPHAPLAVTGIHSLHTIKIIVINAELFVKYVYILKETKCPTLQNWFLIQKFCKEKENQS